MSSQNQVIAVPVENGNLCLHFGHCSHFALFEIDADRNTIKEEKVLEPPSHQPGVLPQWLADQGVNLVIAGGIGNRAVDLFAQRGIRVIPGAQTASGKTVVEQYLEGKLSIDENPCDH